MVRGAQLALAREVAGKGIAIGPTQVVRGWVRIAARCALHAIVSSAVLIPIPAATTNIESVVDESLANARSHPRSGSAKQTESSPRSILRLDIAVPGDIQRGRNAAAANSRLQSERIGQD